MKYIFKTCSTRFDDWWWRCINIWIWIHFYSFSQLVQHKNLGDIFLCNQKLDSSSIEMWQIKVFIFKRIGDCEFSFEIFIRKSIFFLLEMLVFKKNQKYATKIISRWLQIVCQMECCDPDKNHSKFIKTKRSTSFCTLSFQKDKHSS